MKSAFAIACSGLILSVSAAPGFARDLPRPVLRNVNIVGPNGGGISGRAVVAPNPSEGVSGQGQVTITGPHGRSIEGQGRFHTNGEQGVKYQGQFSGEGPRGRSLEGTVKGTATLANPNYTGTNTTTINDKTFSTTSGGGRTVITGPEGRTVTLTPSSLTPPALSRPDLQRPDLDRKIDREVKKPAEAKPIARNAMPASRVWPLWNETALSDNIVVVPVNP